MISDLRVNYIVFSHVVLESYWVELLHAVVNEGKHRSAGLESESLDEALARLKTSREGHIEFFSFLAGHLSGKIEHLVTTLGVNEE